MRNQVPFSAGSPSLASDEVIVRLARLEEQMRHIVNAVEKLANRDAELDASLRAMSDRFTAALAVQGETFRESVRQVCEKCVSRDDWTFWKNLLMGAFIALIAFGWNVLIGSLRR
jgi:hypothetical protein